MSGTRITIRHGLPYGTLQSLAKAVFAVLSAAAVIVLTAYVLAQFALGYVN